MDDRTLQKRLEEIFRDVFGDDSITICKDTNAQDIEEWDSLAHISILAAVQDEFGVSFDMDEIIAMKNVGDMLEAIGRKYHG
jgi:acyl carrier protein